MLNLIREAGPFALLIVAAGGLGVTLAVATLVLATVRSKAASVTGVICLLLALGILCLGVFGYSLGVVATNASLGNVPEDMKDLLLSKGTEEARANFLIALVCAALPLLAGALAVVARRLAAGIVLAVVVAACSAAMLVAFTRPLPPTGPKVAMVPGLELPHSTSSRRLGAWALIALTPDGLWVDGAKAASLAQALGHPLVKERNTGRLPLLIDQRLQFGQLADVLQAASAAGRHQVDLVVRATDGSDHVVSLRDAPEDESPKPMLLTLWITEDGLHLGAVGGSLDPLPRDWRALNDKLAEIKAAFPSERTLRVTATPETSVGDLVAALDVARERDHQLLFDELVVGRFTLPAPMPDPGPASPRPEGNRDDEVRGRVAAVAPELSAGDLEREALTRYVRARQAAMLGCYERELKRDPSLTGQVVMQVSISTSGRPGEIQISKSSMNNDAVEACMISIVRTWVFPFRPKADVVVAFPFVFSPAR